MKMAWQDCDLDRDEAEIAKFHLSDQNQRLLNITDKMLKYNSIHLSSEDGSKPTSLLDTRCNPLDPPLAWRQSKTLVRLWYFFRSPTGAIILHTILICMSIELIIAAYISFEHQRVLRAILDHNNSSNLRDSLLESAVNLSEWIEVMGLPYTTLPGVSTLSLGIVGLSQIILHQGALIIYRFHWPRIRIDHFGSIFDPIDERRRMLNELRNIVGTFCHSIEYSYRRHIRKMACSDPKRYPVGTFRRFQLGSRKDSALEMKQLVEAVLSVALDRGQNSEWPVVMTTSWHRERSTILFRGLATARYGIFFLVGMINLGVTTFELICQSNERLSRLKSDRAGQNSEQVFHLDPYRLQPLSSEVDREAYLSCNGTLTQLLEVMVFVEVKYYFTLNRSLFFFAWFAMTIYVLHLASAVLYILLGAVFEKVTWLKELIRQMEECSLIASQDSIRMIDREELSRERNQVPLLGSTLQMIKVYLNYELFRRQYQPFRLLERAIILLVVIFAFFCLLLCYLIMSHLNLSDASMRVLIFNSSIMVVTLNAPFIISSYKTMLVTKLMKSLNNLMSHIARIRNSSRTVHSQQLSIPMDLWIRQSLDNKSCEHFCAANLLGLYVTYGLVLKINAYFGAIWFLWMKMSH